MCNTKPCNMLKHNLGCIIFFITVLSLTEANFDFKLGYCRFKCVNPCKKEKEADNPLGDAKKPSGYYWREFYGKIPTDAYPLGKSTQYPQTYIGLAYEPKKNGTFPVTIVDGLDYVYVVQNGTVIKSSKRIQILCTMEPDRLVWIKLTKANYATLDKDMYVNVLGTYHQVLTENPPKVPKIEYHYVAKYSTCKIYYAGYKTGFESQMEYVLLDGTPKNVDNGLWLFYKKIQKEKNEGKNKGKSFFSHHYEYNIRPDSIIPSFYKQLNIGDCSITCTNEGSSKKSKLKSDTQSLASMAYYWTPGDIVNEDEAFRGANDFIGQAYAGAFNWYDVGHSSGGSYVYIVAYKYTTGEWFGTKILSSNHPEMLEWVNTTYDTFNQLDRSLLIPGGEMDNGTETFIGKNDMYSGSVRVFGNETFFYGGYGGLNPKNFEVLMFKDPKN